MPSIIENAFLTSVLTEEFERHAGADQIQYNSRQLNYVWLDKLKGGVLTDHFLGIPPEQLQRALRNADLYPDTNFHIWIDFDNLDSKIKSLLTKNPCPFLNEKVTVRNLNEIADYKANPLTKLGVKIGVRSDMVRLQVLSHVLSTDSDNEVYYSDFDVLDVKINHPEMRDIMAKYGANLGLTRMEDLDISGYENGFMGFRRGFGSAFLDGYIQPASQEMMYAQDGRYNTGETPITMLFTALQQKIGSSSPLGLEVLQETGTKIAPIPKEAIYAFLNPSHPVARHVIPHESRAHPLSR